MKGEQVIGGVSCSEVLADLSDYVDGNLSAQRVKELRQHVVACTVCEKFGADFAATLTSLRSHSEAPALPPSMAERLRAALKEH